MNVICYENLVWASLPQGALPWPIGIRGSVFTPSKADDAIAATFYNFNRVAG